MRKKHPVLLQLHVLVGPLNLCVYSIIFCSLVQLGLTVETIHFNTLSGELTAKRQGLRDLKHFQWKLLEHTFNGMEKLSKTFNGLAKLKQEMESSWYCPPTLVFPPPNLM